MDGFSHYLFGDLFDGGCDKVLDMSIFCFSGRRDQIISMAESELKASNLGLGLPIEEFVTYRLLQLTSRLNKQATHILNDTCGLRLPEWRCLAMIGRYGTINLLGISDLTGMDKGLVTRTVQSLVEQGYVSTRRQVDDRRNLLATLTRSGTKLFEQVFPIMEQRQLRLLSALSPADRKAFYRITDRLMRSIEAREGEQKLNEAS